VLHPKTKHGENQHTRSPQVNCSSTRFTSGTAEGDPTFTELVLWEPGRRSERARQGRARKRDADGDSSAVGLSPTSSIRRAVTI
jgi:hypothetical protein